MDRIGSQKGGKDPRLAVFLTISPSANEIISLSLSYVMEKRKAEHSVPSVQLAWRMKWSNSSMGLFDATSGPVWWKHSNGAK